MQVSAGASDLSDSIIMSAFLCWHGKPILRTTPWTVNTGGSASPGWPVWLTREPPAAQKIRPQQTPRACPTIAMRQPDPTRADILAPSPACPAKATTHTPLHHPHLPEHHRSAQWSYLGCVEWYTTNSCAKMWTWQGPRAPNPSQWHEGRNPMTPALLSLPLPFTPHTLALPVTTVFWSQPAALQMGKENTPIETAMGTVLPRVCVSSATP